MQFPDKLAAGVLLLMILGLACPAQAQSALELSKPRTNLGERVFEPAPVTGEQTTLQSSHEDSTTTGDVVCFYEDVDYRGNTLCAGEGTAQVMAGWDNRVSSVKVKAGHSLRMYQYDNYRGNSMTIIGNEPNLVARRFNDTMSSFKVDTGEAVVCFYEHVDYAGASYCTDAGAAQMPTGWNDRASSARVQPGHTVRLYQHNNYGGASLALTGNEPNLVARGFNDAMSSFKVVETER